MALFARALQIIDVMEQIKVAFMCLDVMNDCGLWMVSASL
jgi:hypothetical protein